MIKLLHTADLQLGENFHFVPGDRGADLRKHRLDAIDRVADLARADDADAVLVAGDLFDSNTLDPRAVALAADKLRAVPCPVVVIPGNHDHGGADSVFRSTMWRRQCPPNVTVCLDFEPVVLAGGRLVVLPAPLLRRHEPGAPTLRIGADAGQEHEGAVRVGLAHGGIHGFDGEFDAPNMIDPGFVARARLDYLALGDWHGCKRVDARTWYAGTPEPDRFKDNDPGHVLRVSIEAPGAEPTVVPHQIARTRWLRKGFELNGAADIDVLVAWLKGLGNDDLVRLELRGVLDLTQRDRLEEALSVAEARLLFVRRRGPGIVIEPTAEELAAIATDGYVRAAVEELKAVTEGDGPTAVVAGDALHLLHRLHAEGSRAGGQV
jgi:DNA repair exonuclease SbcCD nuclease subunit